MSGRGKRPWKEPKEPVPPGLVSQSLQGMAPDPPAAAAASVGPGSSAALAATVPTHWKKKRDGKQKVSQDDRFPPQTARLSVARGYLCSSMDLHLPDEHRRVVATDQVSQRTELGDLPNWHVRAADVAELGPNVYRVASSARVLGRRAKDCPQICIVVSP